MVAQKESDDEYFSRNAELLGSLKNIGYNTNSALYAWCCDYLGVDGAFEDSRMYAEGRRDPAYRKITPERVKELLKEHFEDPNLEERLVEVPDLGRSDSGFVDVGQDKHIGPLRRELGEEAYFKHIKRFVKEAIAPKFKGANTPEIDIFDYHGNLGRKRTLLYKYFPEKFGEGPGKTSLSVNPRKISTGRIFFEVLNFYQKTLKEKE